MIGWLVDKVAEKVKEELKEEVRKQVSYELVEEIVKEYIPEIEKSVILEMEKRIANIIRTIAANRINAEDIIVKKGHKAYFIVLPMNERELYDLLNKVLLINEEIIHIMKSTFVREYWKRDICEDEVCVEPIIITKESYPLNFYVRNYGKEWEVDIPDGQHLWIYGLCGKNRIHLCIDSYVFIEDCKLPSSRKKYSIIFGKWHICRKKIIVRNVDAIIGVRVRYIRDLWVRL